MSKELLPGVYRVTAFACRAIAETHLRVNALMRDAGHAVRTVSVQSLEAAASFRSERYLRCNGSAAGDLWAPLSGNYRTGDGRWIRLHCNFEHHERAALRVLGASPHREDVMRAIERWDAYELEAAVLDAGGAAAAERSSEEWNRLAHPPGPLISIQKIGEADPRPLRIDPVRPLARLRVLDLTRVIAGPVAGRTLAAYGADVLRIGAQRVPVSGDIELMDTGFGKRFAELDITLPHERQRLLELAQGANVFVQSFRHGSLESYGLGAHDVTQISPGIIYVSLTAYGEGPWHARRGFDSLVQLATGITRTGATIAGQEEPLPLPAQALDHATGWFAVTGALSALERQQREGGSWHVQVSLARTAHYLKSLGTFDGLAIPDLTFDDVRPVLGTMPSPFGVLTYVRFPGEIDDLNLQWQTSPRRQGQDRPEWILTRGQ